MDTIFINSKYSKISDLHRLLLNLTDKINLKVSDKFITLSYLSMYDGSRLKTESNLKSKQDIISNF